MSHDRDWIKQTIAHKQPAGVPYNFTFTPPAQARAEEHYKTDDLTETPEAMNCGACARLWAIEDGIYNFKTAGRA